MLDLVTTTCKYVRHLLCGMCAFYCTVNNAHTFMYATEDVQVDKLGPCVHNALIVMTEYDDTDKMHNIMHSKHRNLRYLCQTTCMGPDELCRTFYHTATTYYVSWSFKYVFGQLHPLPYLENMKVKCQLLVWIFVPSTG